MHTIITKPMFTKEKTCVISLGGSIIVPDDIDSQYLIAFRDMVVSEVQNGWKFIITVGGGKTARNYIAAAQQTDPSISSDDKDWLGIHSTRLNAHLLRSVLRSVAHPRINKNPNDLEDFYHSDKAVFLASGWRPGFSTDYCATLLAKYLGVSKIANFSNIDFVYDQDPRTNSDAQKIEQMTWDQMREIVGSEWSPGLNAPFDPVACRLASEIGLEVVIMNGKNIHNFRNYLAGEPFEGTLIRS